MRCLQMRGETEIEARSRNLVKALIESRMGPDHSQLDGEGNLLDTQNTLLSLDVSVGPSRAAGAFVREAENGKHVSLSVAYCNS
jgi:hypothetical protein